MYQTMLCASSQRSLAPLVDDTINSLTTQPIPGTRKKRKLAPAELRAWIAFMRAGLRMTRAMDRDAEATGRLLFSEHHILATLNEGPPEGIRPTELAEQAGLTKSGLTRALDRLETQHLIERRVCPSDARLDGKRSTDHRALPPTRLPARAYLAVVGTGTVVGECVLGERAGRTAKGWTLPVTKPRRYRKPRPLADFGLAKTPRSFRYVEK